MDFALDAGQRAWLAEVREFLHANVTAELRAELAEHDLEAPYGPGAQETEVARFRRKIGEKGWFGLNWPREYAGLALGAVHQHLLMSEFEYSGGARAGPDGDVGGADDHAARHRAEQNRMAAIDRQRRNDLRGRLFRA